MKRIIFFLFMVFICSQIVNGQTHDYNIKINPAHDPDSVYILSTANSGSFAGRGRFKSLPVIASLLRPYTGHIDTAYITTDSLVIITLEGDTLFFQGGGATIDTMYTNDGDSVVLYLSDNSVFGAPIAHHFATAWDATSAQLVLSTPQAHSGGDFTISEGSGIDLSTSGSSLNSTTTISATDASTTNEIQDITLTGSSQPFTVDLSSDATDVTITGAGITTATRTGNALTLTSTEVDGSTSNEIQTISASGSTIAYTINLSLGGSSVTFKEGTNITIDRTVDTLTINSTGSALTYSTYNVSDATSHTYGLTDSESDPHGSVTLAEGTGIGLATTGTTDDGIVTITNTGDTNAADDVLVSDTASMLSHYIERGDTAAMLAHFLERGNNLSDVANTNTSLNNLLPSQTGNSGKYLTTDGSNTSWAAASGYTDEQAQDAVGSMIDGTLTYVDATPLLKVADGGIGPTQLASTAVIPGSYTLTSLTVDEDGRITSASNGTTPITVQAIGRPVSSLSNSSASDQDYSSVYTIPANYLTTDKAIRVTLNFQYITGTSTATLQFYLKLGSTKVYTSSAVDYGNGATRSISASFLIQGTAAAGASVGVETAILGNVGNTTAANQTTQPINLATNGTLTIVPGIKYSGTGGTESVVLRTYMIEYLN